MKFTEIKNAGLADDEIQQQLEKTSKNLMSNKQKLKRSINDAARQRKRRQKVKDLISDISMESHEKNKRLKHNRPGRPALEDPYGTCLKPLQLQLLQGHETNSGNALKI